MKLSIFTQSLLSRLFRLQAVITLLAVAGCQSEASKYEVSGTVTLDGVPLPYGTVTFSAPGENNVSHSSIDSSGRYRLEAAAATYFVAVEASPPLAEPATDRRYEGGVPPNAKRQPGPTAPEKYANPFTSELSVTVSGDGASQFDIELQ